MYSIIHWFILQTIITAASFFVCAVVSVNLATSTKARLRLRILEITDFWDYGVFAMLLIHRVYARRILSLSGVATVRSSRQTRGKILISAVMMSNPPPGHNRGLERLGRLTPASSWRAGSRGLQLPVWHHVCRVSLWIATFSLCEMVSNNNVLFPDRKSVV